jgi:cell division protein FtsB
VDLAQLPNLGVAAALVIVIGYLLAANRSDRAQHRETVTALITQHAADRVSDKAKLAQLSQRVDDLEAEVDLERDERRKAQDLAADAQRRAVAAEAQIALYHRITEGGSGDRPATTYLDPPA